MHEQISFPNLSSLSEMRVGALLWSSYETKGVSGMSPFGNGVEYGNEHVWLYHTGTLWFAGLEKDGECGIAGVWKSCPKGGLDENALIRPLGSLAQYFNPELTSAEKTERIWDLLQAESSTMMLRSAVKPSELPSQEKFNQTLLDSSIKEILSAWKSQR